MYCSKNHYYTFRSQPTYTLWKPARKNYKRNSFKTQFSKELMQFDLMDQRQHPEKDPETGKSMNFGLIAVDSYSRFVFCVPLSHNTSQNIQNALQTIFNTGYKPEKALVSVDVCTCWNDNIYSVLGRQGWRTYKYQYKKFFQEEWRALLYHVFQDKGTTS